MIHVTCFTSFKYYVEGIENPYLNSLLLASFRIISLGKVQQPCRIRTY